MPRRLPEGLLCLEDHQTAVYVQKTYERSFMPRRPPDGLQSLEDHQTVFYVQKICRRSSICRRPRNSLLCLEGLKAVFCVYKIFGRYSVSRWHPNVLLGLKYIQMVFYIQKPSRRSSVSRRPPDGLLYKTIRWSSTSIRSPGGLWVLKTQKTAWRYLRHGRPPEDLDKKDPLDVFWSQYIAWRFSSIEEVIDQKASSHRGPSGGLLELEEPLEKTQKTV